MRAKRTPIKNKQRLTGPQVRARYGGVSDMWIWRRENLDPEWPKPILIGRRKYYDEDELDAYDEAHRAGADGEAA